MNILDVLLGRKVVSPLPDNRGNPQAYARQDLPPVQQNPIIRGAFENLIYNNKSRRLFPQSPLYKENVPQYNRRMRPEDIDKLLPMIIGASIRGLQQGRAIPVRGMQKGVINMEPRDVRGIQDFKRTLE